MPYSKFTIKRLRDEFNLKIEDNSNIFDKVKIKPSNWLIESLDMAFDSPLLSEKARSELIITPILQEMRKINNKSISIFSGLNLDVQSDSDLNGECDFILTKGNHIYFIDTPLISIVEAKKQDIDLGLAQCIAQMIGAYIFNEQENNNIKTIFGCVTTGEIWQFMKLEYANENYIATIEKKKYYIDNVEKILGVIQQIIDFYKD